MRDLADLPLLEATKAISEGRVLMNGAPYQWEADEMAYWLRESPADAGEAEREAARCHFTVAPAGAVPAPG